MTLLPLTPALCPMPDQFAAACTSHGLDFKPYGPAYETLDLTARERREALTLLRSPFTNSWLQDYMRRQTTSNTRIGILEVNAVHVTDDWGLVLQPESSFLISSISGFGWTEDQFRYLASKGHISQLSDDNYAIDDTRRTRVSLNGTAALLSFPGAYTYGHWITDMCARLELLAANHDMAAIDHFLLPKHAKWMDPFLAAYGVPRERIVELDKSHIFKVSHLLMPTTLSQHHKGTLPVPFARQMFRRLAAISFGWGHQPRWRKSPPVAELVYIKHTALTSAPGRELANEDALIAVVEDMGGRVLDPLKLALPALLNRLREAKLVVGLDSSALHNLAMAPTDLMVIQTEPRYNMLHPSIQEATGKRVAFIKAEQDESDYWSVKPKRLRALIQGALTRH